MKAVILAGGLGTRISEQSHMLPKPMIEIGGRPILWHIMKAYGAHGIVNFVICCGYKGAIIKEYFANYFLHTSDVTFDLAANSMKVHTKSAEPWTVTLVDTGQMTQTGGRLARIRDYIDGTFCLTYGDGLSDVDIKALIAFHQSQNVIATVTAIQPAGRYGTLEIEGARVACFDEKPANDGRWVSGGFFVCEPELLDRIGSDDTVLEREPLSSLAADGELAVYRHEGFWAAMDTLRDKIALEKLWESGDPPWKVWE